MKMLDPKGKVAASSLHVPRGIKTMSSAKLFISKKVWYGKISSLDRSCSKSSQSLYIDLHNYFCSDEDFVIFPKKFSSETIFFPNLLPFYSSVNQSEIYKGGQGNYLESIKSNQTAFRQDSILKMYVQLYQIILGQLLIKRTTKCKTCK